MDIEDIKLIEPVVELKSEFLAMVKDFRMENNDVIDGIGSIDADNFEDSVSRAKDHAKGMDLPEGWVAASTYWLLRRGRIIGTCNLRHELNEFLRNWGGHIGFSICPSQRGRGYGRRMLALVLKKAQAVGIKKALVACDDNNIASARVIEKNGGKLADKVKTEYADFLVRRYWIELKEQRDDI
jgi:predicted acetyltransferase